MAFGDGCGKSWTALEYMTDMPVDIEHTILAALSERRMTPGELGLIHDIREAHDPVEPAKTSTTHRTLP
ncbi:hypothetical protein [Paenirhodobacter sp.]|uniref:hypothetical protein n=1 Tax=Paenirhodobacter sp. TaxID=1965326 RepID=UPI003B41F040